MLEKPSTDIACDRMDDKEQTLIESQVRDLSVDGPDQRTRLDLGLIFVII